MTYTAAARAKAAIKTRARYLVGAGVSRCAFCGRRPEICQCPPCEVCGLPVAGHLQCRDCRILAGPGHIVGHLEDGRCTSCTRVDRRAG